LGRMQSSVSLSAIRYAEKFCAACTADARGGRRGIRQQGRGRVAVHACAKTRRFTRFQLRTGLGVFPTVVRLFTCAKTRRFAKFRLRTGFVVFPTVVRIDNIGIFPVFLSRDHP